MLPEGSYINAFNLSFADPASMGPVKVRTTAGIWLASICQVASDQPGNGWKPPSGCQDQMLRSKLLEPYYLASVAAPRTPAASRNCGNWHLDYQPLTTVWTHHGGAGNNLHRRPDQRLARGLLDAAQLCRNFAKSHAKNSTSLLQTHSCARTRGFLSATLGSRWR